MNGQILNKESRHPVTLAWNQDTHKWKLFNAQALKKECPSSPKSYLFCQTWLKILHLKTGFGYLVFIGWSLIDIANPCLTPFKYAFKSFSFFYHTASTLTPAAHIPRIGKTHFGKKFFFSLGWKTYLHFLLKTFNGESRSFQSRILPKTFSFTQKVKVHFFKIKEFTTAWPKEPSRQLNADRTVG